MNLLKVITKKGEKNMKKTTDIFNKNTMENNPSKKQADEKRNEQLESLIISLGSILSMSKSLVVCLDILISDEINSDKSDIENLIIVLKSQLNEALEEYEKLERYLEI